MIARIWHGYTSLENADEYEIRLREDILPGIGRVEGYKGAQLLRRNHASEVEFITITYFTDLDAVVAFAGEDYTKAVIGKGADKLLTHFDERSAHYDLVDNLVTPEFLDLTRRGQA
jgi:heme-degrading monooxygenase HmoA